ncbi:uncharacterized protein K452DRAFT_38103 [Aplosporella prunicola CBS 121167]|uniref:Uncharacterized protein n=1 Tax=Aplosporella prunicola CBS 121167 TaxID=1176127 RepID=A0A6A6BAQ3_9PEZI|nr:uncharacterized protein K452DRAFT_38103 [Aplosporella prunicola CBS 121167]KAF2141322.1 hypothetical protein K452DRAFT_38103 [Aplosporella prunicola CBS 121167]
MAEAIGVATSIIAILELARSAVLYIDGVKNASKDIKSLAREIYSVSGILKNIKDLVKTPKDAGGGISSSALQSLGGEEGPLQQFEQLLRAMNEKLGVGRNDPPNLIERLASKMAFPLKSEERQNILAAIERYEILFLLAMGNDQSQLLRKLRGDLGESLRTVLDGISEIKLVQKSQQSRELQREAQNIINWLSEVNFLATQAAVLARRTEGTGQWFLESNEFRQWVAGDNKVLWCPGDPGVGKTILAATSVDYLHQKYSNQDDVAVFCVYCNYKDYSIQTATDLLAGICTQSMCLRSSVSDSSKSYHEADRQIREGPTKEAILDLLGAEIKQYRKVFIVVDALDEFGDKEQQDEFLSELQKIDTAHVLFTSRTPADVNPFFPERAVLTISAHSKDIERYLRTSVQLLDDFVKNDPDLQEEIVAGVTQSAGGMFLLARLQLEMFKDKLNALEIRKAIENLPRGGDALRGTYEEAVKRIDSQPEGYRVFAYQAITWIIHTWRQLTVEELRHALAVARHSSLDKDALPSEKHLTAFCAGLVVIDQENKKVRIVHHSAEAYLKETVCSPPRQAQNHIATTCLQYLLLGPMQTHDIPSIPLDQLATHLYDRPKSLKEEPTDIEAVYPFARYARRSWDIHLNGAKKPGLQSANRICGGSALLPALYAACTWRRPPQTPSRFGGKVGNRPNPNTYRGLLAALAAADADLAATSPGKGATALHYAVAVPNDPKARLVELLLDNGTAAHAGVRDNQGATPLDWAAVAQRDECVQLLSSGGAAAASV